jgi:hypothetical protein
MTTHLKAPALVPTLPGRAYSDPGFFALERGRLFARSWSAVAMAAEAFTLSGRGGLGLLPRTSADDDRRYYGMTLLPQVFLNLLPDNVVVHRMRPVAVDRSVIGNGSPTGAAERQAGHRWRRGVAPR